MVTAFRATLRWLALAACLCGAAAGAHAAAPAGEPLLQRFTPADFKATPYLFGIANDADGRLYVGSADGLLRMQGREWQTIPLPEGVAANGVVRGSDGHIYVTGYDCFGTVATAPDGSAVYTDLRDAFGLKGAARGLGSIWQVLPVTGGVYFVAEHRILFYAFDGHHRQWPLAPNAGFSVYQDQLYTQVKESGLVRFDDGRLVPVPGGDLMRGHQGAELIDQGTHALAVSVGGFFRLEGGVVVALEVPAMPDSAGIFSTVHALGANSFVVGTANGDLLRYDAGAHLLDHHRIAHNSVGGLDYDSEGGLWATTEDELVRLQEPAAWSRIALDDLGGVVADVEFHRGALWLAVGARGLARMQETAQGPQLDWIAAEKDRQVLGLVGTADSLLVAQESGIDALSDDGKAVAVVRHELPVYMLDRSRFDPGLVYAAGDEGIYLLRRRSDGWKLAALLPAPELATQALIEVAPGEIWVNNARGMPERWTIDLANDRLLRRQRFPLHAPGQADSEPGARMIQMLRKQVYLTIGRHAYRFDGAAFVPFDGPPFSLMQSPNAFNTLETPVGAFAYTGSRLYREGTDGRWRREDFGARPAASQSVLRYGSDGVLRLSVWRALLQYRPGDVVPAAMRPLAVRMTSLGRIGRDGVVTNLPVDPHGVDHFEQNEGLTMRFGVFTAEPGVEYRYRLPGIADAFSEWREQGMLNFTGLDQPGAYDVEVEARTPSGRVVAPLRYAFEIAPRWYQVTVIRLVGLLLFLVGLLLLIRWRERRQARRYAERQQHLEERIAERTEELEVANRKLEELATEDGLTGVANRRALETGLQREWARCLDLRVPVALLMIDVDRFKQYNDRHGHIAGDAVLRHVAERLAIGLEPQRELLARYGGEEFCLLLPGVGLDAAQLRAEQMRRTIDSEGSDVTVSIGVAARVPTVDDSPEALMRAADQMLYEAKRRGRNRVEVADSR